MHAELTKDILAVTEVTERSVVAVGAFDGVHVGHRSVLGRAVSIAAARLAPSVALTFNPHPMEWLDPPGQGRLSPLGEKYRRIAACGVSRIAVLPFRGETAGWSARRFVEEVLVGRLHAEDVVVGFNFTCGRGGEADAEALGRLGRGLGFRVHIIEPVAVDGDVASSSTIRRALRAGRVEVAARLLGRAWSLEEIVRPGAGRGRGLGFPTANLTPADERLILPAAGVYEGCAELDGRAYEALVYVGRRPTFEVQGQSMVEAYLPGYEGGALHGRSLKVAFIRHLRSELTFASEAQLKEQMLRDLAGMRRRDPSRRGGASALDGGTHEGQGRLEDQL